MLLGLLVLGSGAWGLPAGAAPVLDCDLKRMDGVAVSDDGTVSLHWQASGEEVSSADCSFELQQAYAKAPDFHGAKLRYSGPDDSSVLSGLAEGSYFFRVRAVDASGIGGDWSQPLQVRVKFMDRGPLLLLLGTGGVVAVATVGAILFGFAKNR